MPYTVKDFKLELAKEYVNLLPAEERLKGLPAEERLKGLPAEEILSTLSHAQIEAYLQRLAKKPTATRKKKGNK